GCCDDSPNRHASAHAAATGHPLIRSIQPGEDWSWCFVDEVAMRLGDVLGERRVFSIGVAGFGVASLLCALAPSIEVLVAARVLQGIFGALLAPSALAVIITAFPPDERGAAIGSWTAWGGIAMLVGPLVGGWLVDVTSWRWIFAINIPLVALKLFIVAA